MRRLTVGVVLAALPFVLVSPAVPQSQGVDFGAYAHGSDRLVATDRLEEALGRSLDFVRVFEVWNAPFPTEFHEALISRDQKMLLSVRAKRSNGTYVSWRDIADAQPGTAIHSQLVGWVERVRDIGQPVWFSFNHEPEIVENISNGVDDDFIAAWRRVVTEFRDRGVDNVEFVWIMTDFSFRLPPSDRRHATHWYPGDEFVDYIGADAYNWSNCRPGQNVPWRTLEYLIDPLRLFGAAHPDKGLMLAEWASTIQGGDKASWIIDAGELLKQPGWEQFMAVAYWSRVSSYPDCKFPVDSTPESMAAFATMGADPFYGGSGSAQAPSVSLTAPAEGATVSGSVTVSADASDDEAVDSVEFTVDGAPIGSDTNGANGWSVAWDTTGVTNASHAVTAVATDSGGLSGSDTVNVIVANDVPVDEPPSVSLTAPLEGATVSGSVTVVADASDDDAVDSVAFSVDGTPIGSDTDGSDGWSVSWDTTGVTNASHAVAAVATDSGGLTGSDTVNVIVANDVPTDEPPSVSLTAPAEGATVSGSVTVSADASDDEAVDSVAFTVDGAPIGTDTNGANGWSVTWDTTGVTNASHTVTATATDTAAQTATDSVGVTVDNGGGGGTVLFSGSVDSSNATAPRWTSTVFTASVSGPETLTLDWAGTANLRFDVRRASDNVWVGSNLSTDQPKSITANLTAGTAYRIAVWSMSGAAPFTVTTGSPTPTTDEIPTVGVTSPADGATVGGTVTVSADASDDDAVDSVAFTVDGASIGTDTNGADGWSVTWDTTGVTNASHTVTATATDTAAQTATDSVGVTVDNGGGGGTVLFSGSVDSSNATAPRWTSTVFTASASGPETLTLDWAGTANLRFDVRRASDNVWLGSNLSTDHPKSITANLTAGTAYRIAVWSMSGTASFTVTTE